MLSKRTCALTFWCQLLAVEYASAATATFRNQCDVEVNVYDNHSSCQLGAGDSTSPKTGCDRDIDQSAVYRNGKSTEATHTWFCYVIPLHLIFSNRVLIVVVEFSYGDNKVWYDISTGPPGAADCDSYETCAKKTGKEGFNVGVMTEPVEPEDDSTFPCNSLLCQYAECPDAFRFPTDESKVKNCPEQQHFNITFCP